MMACMRPRTDWIPTKSYPSRGGGGCSIVLGWELSWLMLTLSMDFIAASLRRGPHCSDPKIHVCISGTHAHGHAHSFTKNTHVCTTLCAHLSSRKFTNVNHTTISQEKVGLLAVVWLCSTSLPFMPQTLSPFYITNTTSHTHSHA